MLVFNDLLHNRKDVLPPPGTVAVRQCRGQVGEGFDLVPVIDVEEALGQRLEALLGSGPERVVCQLGVKTNLDTVGLGIYVDLSESCGQSGDVEHPVV